MICIERWHDEEALRDCLTDIVRTSLHKPSLARFTLQPSAYSSSFASYIISLQADDGSQHFVFFKDFGDCRRPVHDLNDRRIRELLVYQAVLKNAGLGTAEYLGSEWDESQDRYWLFLEYVDGSPLKESSFENYLPAVRWLGSLYDYSVRNAQFLEACSFLQRQDRAFFQATAEAAHRAVSKISRETAQRLAAILSQYDPLVEAMASQPPVLTHGSYSREHVLKARGTRPPRLCPVDWESAGLGASLFDLAYIVDGYTPPHLDRMIGAYRDALISSGHIAPSTDELLHLINCYSLHRTMKWLSGAWDEEFAESDVENLVTRAERLTRLVL